MKKIALFILFAFWLLPYSQANNIAISNISVLNNGNNTVKIIEFDLSWENSWRAASTGNYDGAWVFFKFKDNDGKWKHLNFTGTDITIPAGATHTIGNSGAATGVGMFIYRSALGAGTFTVLNIRAGIQNYPGVFDVKGFAIEMVYIPQGSFYLGDGSWVNGEHTYRNGSTAAAFQVTGNGNTTTLGTGSGQLNQSTAFTGTITGFPTGFSSFWIMKYELSQGGYRDFLNTLTYQQQTSRMNIPPNSAAGTKFITIMVNELSLEIATPGVNTTTPAIIGCDASNNNIYDESGDGEWKAWGFLSWSDCAAYLDWAGLRPMTEMEFEKVCRGPLLPVVHEYAWGDTTLASVSYTAINAYQNNSSISNASSTEGNAYLERTYNVNLQTLRGGIFANAGSSRVSAGAGYYGAMELTGSLAENVVTSSSAAGRSFNGKHGNGVLNVAGEADENFWPGINGNSDHSVANTAYAGSSGVTAAGGATTRGGSYTSPDETYGRVSIRFNVETGMALSNRSYYLSIRGVRD